MKVKIIFSLLILLVNALIVENSTIMRKRRKSKGRLRNGFASNVVKAYKKASPTEKKEFIANLLLTLSIDIALTDEVYKCFKDEPVEEQYDLEAQSYVVNPSGPENDETAITQTINFIKKIIDCKPIHIIIVERVKEEVLKQAFEKLFTLLSSGWANLVSFGKNSYELISNLQDLKEITSDVDNVNYSLFREKIGSIFNNVINYASMSSSLK